MKKTIKSFVIKSLIIMAIIIIFLSLLIYLTNNIEFFHNIIVEGDFSYSWN